jgi:predicted MFS family arabinose efflux permease
MFSRRVKNGVFLLEGLNSFATVIYFYYFYFYMQQEFGFGNKANLVLAALNGATYAFGSLFCGKLAHRLGYFNTLKLGFGIMAGALAIGSQVHSAGLQIAVMLVTDIGMCFTWPTLEALVSEGEEPAEVPHMVGVYNIIWAATGAGAYFIGGALFQTFGMRSMFYIPMSVTLVQFIIAVWLQRQAGVPKPMPALSPLGPLRSSARPNSAVARNFLRMGWWANPFAYIAINTVVAVVPGIASKLGLSTMEAGFVCSVWCFGRLGAFALLWYWEGWHYRFSWLCGAFAALVLSFTAMLTLPNLPALVMAQLIFGGAIGLIYYSSLYYSMDVSEVKSEHGGIHEAVIGVGNFAGPAVGAVSLHFLPQYANSGAFAVSVLLLCGLGGLLARWRAGR